MRHRQTLKRECHDNEYLQNAFNQSPESFQIEILETTTKENLITLEQQYLDKYQSYKREIGYNILEKAYSTANYSHKPETIKKLKTKIVSEETKNKIRQSKIGNKASPETIAKMSINNSGSTNPAAKLNESDVLRIRQIYANKTHTVKAIAELYQVGKGTIENIIYNRKWQHIQLPKEQQNDN